MSAELTIQSGLRILRLSEGFKRLGIEKTTAYARLKDPEKYPDFPKPVDLDGIKGFLESEIDDYIRSRAARRGTAGDEAERERRKGDARAKAQRSLAARGRREPMAA